MSDPFNEQSRAFIHWLKAGGAELSDKIELADLRAQNTGRGVVATADIAEDETLFRIPRSLILTAANSALLQTHADLVEDFTDEPWATLILAMVYEHFRGSASPWAPYLAILPASFDTLMYWDPHDLDQLQASAVRQRIGKDHADADFRERLVPTILKSPEVFLHVPAGDPLPATADDLHALLHRFASCIMAYAFDVFPADPSGPADEEGYVSEPDEADCPKGMVPMADMLNADADRNNAKLMSETDYLEMKAVRPIAKGEEIFNDYGSLPRSELLRRYGYITDNYAPYDVVELSLDGILAAFREWRAGPVSSQDIDALCKYLDKKDLLTDGYDLPVPASPAEALAHHTAILPPDLHLLLSTLARLKPGMTPTDFRALASDLPSDADTAMSILTLLGRCAAARLGEYKTSIAEDERVLEEVGPGMSSRTGMAVRVRLGEKRILEGWVAVAEGTGASSNERKRGAETEEEREEGKRARVGEYTMEE